MDTYQFAKLEQTGSVPATCSTHNNKNKRSQYNGSTKAFQAQGAGSIPAGRSSLGQKETRMNYTNKINDLQSVIKSTKENNYVVGSFDGMHFSVSSNPAIHTTFASARAECGRLANDTPGKMYIILQLKGAELVPQAPRMSI